VKFKQVTTLEYELHLTDSEALDAMTVAERAGCDVSTLLTAITASGLHRAKDESENCEYNLPTGEIDEDGNSIELTDGPEV